MGLNTITYVLSKGYTKNTSDSLGAIKGAPATIKSITEIDGGHRVTFEWTGTSGTKQTSTLDVMNGIDGYDGKDGKTPVKGVDYKDGEKGDDGIGITSVTKTKTEGLVDTYTITFSDGSTFEYEITNGQSGSDGKPGKDAVSPTITENADNTDKIYKLDVTTVDGTFTTPNLRGKDGSGSSTGEENVIESIKVNGVAQTVAKDKSVDITVPTVDVDKNYVDTELIKKANVSDIPSLNGYVTEEELNAKGYLTEVPSEYITEEELTEKGYLTSHQDISGKVDKVNGKSLIADTEIERLKSVKNYDDTEIKTELTKKANSTDIPTKVSGLQNDSNYQTDTDVTITLTPYATKTYVGEQISNADHLKREIVTEIPKPETADKNTIYMLKIESVTGNDKYREYLLIDGTVQCVGDTSVDLTDYAKTTDVDKKLNNKADKTEIPTIPTNVSEFTNDAGYLTEHQDISNLVVKEEGKGLSSNDYTSEEKTKLSGVGTSQGRNIIPYPYSQTTKIVYGVTFTDNKDGSIGIFGTQDGSTSRPYMGIGIWWNETDKKTSNIPISANTDFTISANCDSNNAGLRYYVYDESGSKLADNIVYGTATKTLKFDVDTWVALCIETAANSGIYDCICKPQLELGAIAHAYESPIESNVNIKKEIDKISTSQGRNLISYPYDGTEGDSYGITWTVNEDGSVTANGMASKDTPYSLIYPYNLSTMKSLQLGNTYIISDGLTDEQHTNVGYMQLVRYDKNNPANWKYGVSSMKGTEIYTANDENTLQYGIRLIIRNGATANNITFKPMLEIGAIAHSYEPTTESNVSLKAAIDKKIGTDDVYESLKLGYINSGSIKDFLLEDAKVGTYSVNPAVTDMPFGKYWWRLNVEKPRQNNTDFKATATLLGKNSAMYYMIYNSADKNFYNGWTKIALTRVEDVPVTLVNLNQDSTTGVVGGAIDYAVKNGICQIYISCLDSNNINTVLLSNFVFPNPMLDGANYPIVEMDVGDTRNKVIGSAYIDEGKLYAELETKPAMAYCSITYICAES